jgi:formylmethanofuran dehydrogenase subunit A
VDLPAPAVAGTQQSKAVTGLTTGTTYYFAIKTLDAAGMVVMPGGIDMHCHIAGPKVNVARKMRPEEKRLAPPVMRTAITHSGTMGSVPSTFATGYKYAGIRETPNGNTHVRVTAWAMPNSFNVRSVVTIASCCMAVSTQGVVAFDIGLRLHRQR